MQINTQKSVAFTLAETLITLMIIGVVAALTIPVLLNLYQDIQFKTAWKVTFSELSQVHKMLQSEHDGNYFTECNDLDNSCLLHLYLDKIKAAKICDNPTNQINPNDCIPVTASKNNGKSGLLDSWTRANSNQTFTSAIIDPKGITMNFRMHLKGCASGSSYNIQNGDCGWIMIDVNNLKGPNIAGKDIFYIQLTPDERLLPRPLKYNDDNYDISSIKEDCETGDGVACSAVYLYDWNK